MKIISRSIAQIADSSEKPDTLIGENSTFRCMSEPGILSTIRRVDEKFYTSANIFRVQLLLTILPFIIAGFGFIWLGRSFSDLAGSAAGQGMIDTGVNILSLAVATFAVGFSALFAILTLDLETYRRRIARRYLFWSLKRNETDLIQLYALIRIRVMLPNEIKVEQMHERDKSIFTPEKLAAGLSE